MKDVESFWARERTRNVFWGRVWRIPFVRGRSLVAFSEGKPCMKNPPSAEKTDGGIVER